MRQTRVALSLRCIRSSYPWPLQVLFRVVAVHHQLMGVHQFGRPVGGVVIGVVSALIGVAAWLLPLGRSVSSISAGTWFFAVSMLVVGLLITFLAVRQLLVERGAPTAATSGSAQAPSAAASGDGRGVWDDVVRYQRWKVRVFEPVVLWILCPILIVTGLLLQISGDGGWISILIGAAGLASNTVMLQLRRHNELPRSPRRREPGSSLR